MLFRSILQSIGSFFGTNNKKPAGPKIHASAEEARKAGGGVYKDKSGKLQHAGVGADGKPTSRFLKGSEALAIENAVKQAETKTVEEAVENTLRHEITQLREDIQTSRENAFGRKIMEAFAAEFMASGFADGTQVKKLGEQIAQLTSRINEQASLLESKDAEIIEAQKKTRIAEGAMKRQQVMQELVAPLGKEKRGIMEDLLKTVKTENLRES